VRLYLGLASAVFLTVLGFTGAIIAFEGDIDHRMRPSLWYAKGGPQMRPKAELIRALQEKYAPARVLGIQIYRQPDLVNVMQMSDKASVYVNPLMARSRAAPPAPAAHKPR
jgi:uncharacterized iron-regulated membrane protein